MMDPVPLDKDIVEKFNGKTLAVVGYETDQVNYWKYLAKLSTPKKMNIMPKYAFSLRQISKGLVIHYKMISDL